MKNYIVILTGMLILSINTVSAAEGPSLSEMDFGGIDNLAFFADKVRNKKTVVIGFLGGSITQGSGASKYANNYFSKTRSKLIKAIEERGAKAKVYNASIGGTGSGYACYRANAQLFCHKPDLLIIEFAVNDGSDKQAAENMESLVRQALRVNPKMGIVLFYTTSAKFVDTHDSKGIAPMAVDLHHRVATLYGLTEVAAGPVVAAGVKDGNWTLKSFFKDGVHPSDIGHALYAKVLSEKLVPCLDLPAPDKTPKLPSLMGQGKLESAQLETIVPIGASNGWERKDKQWNWWEVPIWEAKQEKAPLSFKITGKKPQLIFEGKLQVTWTAGGTKKVKIIQGHTSSMPMPASWHFPVEALPEAPVTVEAVAGNSGKIKGQVWGIFSIQAPK
jgi:lysophospholipase L1-like esterase